MAPLEPQAQNSNLLPLSLFSFSALSVTSLLTYVLIHLHRFSSALKPSQDTRLRVPQRNRNIYFLSCLSFISLSLVTYFAVETRVLSYHNWAQQGNQEDVPNSLWSGWYGTGDETGGGGLGWQLGRWYADVDLAKEGFDVAVGRSRSSWWTQQQLLGLVAFGTFFGVEGRRRNFSRSLSFAFVLLGQIAGLCTAQNLFFIALLLTPTPAAGPRVKNPLWTPHIAAYLVPLALSLLTFDIIPYALENPSTLQLWTFSYYSIPWIFAVGIQSLPEGFGQIHSSAQSAHRSYTTVFFWITAGAFVLHGKQTLAALLDNAPPPTDSKYNFLWSLYDHSYERSTAQRTGVAISKILNAVSDHPTVSAIGWDVLLSGASYIAWAFIRGLDVADILKCSAIPWYHSQDDSENRENKHIKQEVEPAASPKRKRGARSKKTPAPEPASPVPARRSLRSSRHAPVRHEHEHEHEAGSEDEFSSPATVQSAEVATTAHCEGYGGLDVVEDTEAAALAWGLFVLGGLGVVSSSVLGAEVRGR